MPLLRKFGRVREPLPDGVDEKAAMVVAQRVLESEKTDIPRNAYQDPRGHWDPGLPELSAAFHSGDARETRQIVAWALMFEMHVHGKVAETISEAVTAVFNVLLGRDGREERFAVLTSKWAVAEIARQNRHMDTEKISPEPPGPFYFHRAFEDVVRYLRQCSDGSHTTAIRWTDAPHGVYTDAFENPLDFFIGEREKYPVSSFVTVRSTEGWRPPRFDIQEPLIPIPPRSEAGLVFCAVLQGCIRVARLRATSAAAAIEKGIEFGCILGKGTQLDQEALMLLRDNVHYQSSIGNALIANPRRTDASAAVALFTGIPTLPSDQ